MKCLRLVLFVLCVISVQLLPAQRITMTVTVTNRAVTSNSFTVNGSVRVFTNVQGALLIETNLTSINATKSNLFRQLGTYPLAGITLSDGTGPADSGTNAFRLFSSFGGALAGSVTGTWATVTLSTQAGPSTFTMLYPMVNMTGDTNKTNQASDIVTSINTYNTNSFATNAGAMSNFITKGASPLQKIASPKQFEGTLISASNLLATNGYTVALTNINQVSSNAINYGAAFRSPGSGANSLNLGSNAQATGTRAVSIGTMSVAAGNDGVAIGTGATNTTNFGTAVGNLALGTGEGATAIGYTAIASNIGTAVGAVALAGTNATAIGAGATAAGFTAVAVGDTASASAYSAVAAGLTASASKIQSMAIGPQTTASHSNSVAFGPPAHDGTVVSTTTTNQIRIGTGQHRVSVPGLYEGPAATNSQFAGTNIARGSWSYPRADLTSIGNGNNISIPLGTNRFVRLAGTVSASPTLCGFIGAATTGGNDGQEVRIHNDLGFSLTIAQNTIDPVPANRIETTAGADVSIENNGWADLTYSGADARWHITQTYPTAVNATNGFLPQWATISTNALGKDFTNVFYVNPFDDLSSVMTNAPNNSIIWIGNGAWTNSVSLMASNGNLGRFHFKDKTNMVLAGLQGTRAALYQTNEGDILCITNCSNIKILNLNFQGVKVTNIAGVTPFAATWIVDSKDVEVGWCNYDSIGHHGISDLVNGTLRQSTNVLIHDNRFFWVGSWYNNTLGYDGSTVNCATGWRIYRNRMIECCNNVEFYGPEFAVACVENVVEDNYFENPIRNCVADAGATNSFDCRIARNFVTLNNSIRTVSSNNLAAATAFRFEFMRNYRIEDNMVFGMPYGIVSPDNAGITASNYNTGIERNLIVGQDFGSGSEAGIWIAEGTSGKQQRGIQIRGNKIYNMKGQGIIACGTDTVVSDNDLEDCAKSSSEAILVGFTAAWVATNVTVVRNKIRHRNNVPSRPGINIQSSAVGTRHFDNEISSAYVPKITDNGVGGRPSLFVEMVTGIATNPFVVYNTNGAPVVFINSRGAIGLTNGLTNLTAAPTNTILIGADNFGGMNLPNWTDHNGLQSALQPFLGHEQVYWLGTGAGAIGNDQGVLSVTNGGAVVSHPAPVESQLYMQQLDTPATSNGCATRFSAVDLANAGAHNGSSKIGGYFYVATWCSTNLIGQVVGGGAPRTFVGMTTLATEAYTNMVVTTNASAQYVGLMCDASQSTNMFLTARDGSAEFRTNTGLPFIATNVYKFYLFNAPTSRFVNWRLDDAYSGASRSGWFSNNVPTNFMKFGIATKNGTNRAHSVRYSRIYLQAPLAPPR